MSQPIEAVNRVREWIKVYEANKGPWGDRLALSYESAELNLNDIKILCAYIEDRVPGTQVVREFVDENGQGYVIEKRQGCYRWVWREVGEPDDESVWFGGEQSALIGAWEDWELNGSRPYLFPWCKRLEDASKAEN